MTTPPWCMEKVMVYYYRAWGTLKSVLSNRGLGIKAKKCLYEGVIVATALYGAEARGIRSAETNNVNVLEMKCLRSLVGVSRMDRVRNVEVRMARKMRRMDEYRMARKVLMAVVSGGGYEGDRGLDGWCEGGLWQQGNDDGDCASMRERVESPGTYVTE